MYHNHRKSIGYLSALGGMLLMLISTAAQPYGYQWFQNSWYGPPPAMSAPHTYYGYSQAPMPQQMRPNYFNSMSGMGGNVVGVNSSLQDMGSYYLMQMHLPGVKPSDLTMRLNGQVLTIAIQATASQGATGSGQWSSFFQNMQQTFTLPQPVNSSGMRGQLENGVLTMMVPKIGQTLPGQ